MYINQLTPNNNPLLYVPDYLIEDEVPMPIIAAYAPFLQDKMRPDQFIGYLVGLSNLQRNVQGEDEKEDKNACSRWFSTNEVCDVRVFFRMSNNDNNKAIGSKMRLYSLGKAYKKETVEIQHLDSGFIRHNSYTNDNTMVFQNAISTTMLYKSLYAIGGRASVRKTNEPAPDNAAAPTFRWVSALRPQPSEDTEWGDYNHILHPAAIAAGISNPTDYFSDLGGNNALDKIMSALIESRDMDEFADRMLRIPNMELFDEDIDIIIERSNNAKANLSGAADFDRAEGINIVEMMRCLKEFFDEE